VRPQEAEQAVEDLSELFRASLQESQRQTSVADEIRLCELYLEIERLRLGERLQVLWSVPESLRSLPMPSLILQPLVENAVYHGIALLPEGGTVSVALTQENGCLRATVENPVPGQLSRSSGHRIALVNIEQRLQALFGERGSLRCERLDGVYRAELRFPAGASA
jgi:two-component system sensor histidine kinase AlgZ